MKTTQSVNGYHWEPFQKRAGGRSIREERSVVRLFSNGRIAFSAKALEMIKSPEALILYFDSERRAVGFEAAESSHPHAYKLKRGKSKGSLAHLHVKGFPIWIGLGDLKEPLEFRPDVAADGKLQIMLAAGEPVAA